MPNGSHDWETNDRPKLDKFFSRIAEVLKQFAKEHNLRLEKYYHQGPDWEFTFSHPEGGVGKIQVQKCDEDHVMVYPMWWVDYYDTSRRDAKNVEGEKCSLDHNVVRLQLKKMLKLVLSWRKEDLKKGHENPYREKLEMTQEQFDHLNDKYPIPKV